MSDAKYLPPVDKPFEVRALPVVRFQGVPAGSPQAELLYRQHINTLHWFHQRASQAHNAGIADYTKLRAEVGGLSLQYANVGGQEIIDVRRAAGGGEAPTSSKRGMYPISACMAVELQPRAWEAVFDSYITGDNPITAAGQSQTAHSIRTEQVELGGALSNTNEPSGPVAPMALMVRFPGLNQGQLAHVYRTLAGDSTQSELDPLAFDIGKFPGWPYLNPDTPPGDTWICFSAVEMRGDVTDVYSSIRFDVDFKHPLTPALTTIEIYGGHGWISTYTQDTETQVVYEDGSDPADEYNGTPHDHVIFQGSMQAEAHDPSPGLVLGGVMYSDVPDARMWSATRTPYFQTGVDEYLSADDVKRAREGIPGGVISTEFEARTYVSGMQGYQNALAWYVEYSTLPDLPLIGTMRIDKIAGTAVWEPSAANTNSFAATYTTQPQVGLHITI